MIQFGPSAFTWSDQPLEDGRARATLAEPGLRVSIALPDCPDVSALLSQIPAGFTTDGASRPWWAARLIEPWGRAGMAPVWHDYLLTLPRVPKWQADLLFLYALRSVGVPALLAHLLYFAVRLRRSTPV